MRFNRSVHYCPGLKPGQESIVGIPCKVFNIDRGRLGRRSYRSAGGRMVFVPFYCLEDDHVFIKRLKYCVFEPCTSIEKSAFPHVEDKKFDERPPRHPVKEFFLVEPAFVPIVAEESMSKSECPARRAVFNNLLRLQ